MKTPTVALVGRPNVGKSTVFNKLVGKKISIIEDTPGVTRDRIYGDVIYKNYKFHLIDTGGIDLSEADFNKEIIVQASLAIDEADVIVFILDGKEDLNANDFKIRDMLKKSNKKIILAVNKIDNEKRKNDIYNYYELGFDNIIPISGEHNLGIGDLLDEITKDFSPKEDISLLDDKIKFCVIGRPNVGKSSLVNAIVNEEKSIDLKFPDNYVADLAGKDVKFDVKVLEIKERVLPEINEDLYKDLGFDDVKTKEELEAKIKSQLEESKKSRIEEEYAEKCLDKAASNMKIDINEEIIDDEVHRMIHQFENQLKNQGLNIEQYYQFTNTTHEDLHKQMEGEATKRIKYRFLLEAVIDAEKIEVTDKEAEAKADEMAKDYGMTKLEFIEAYGNIEYIKYDMKMRKAIEIIQA